MDVPVTEILPKNASDKRSRKDPLRETQSYDEKTWKDIRIKESQTEPTHVPKFRSTKTLPIKDLIERPTRMRSISLKIPQVEYPRSKTPPGRSPRKETPQVESPRSKTPPGRSPRKETPQVKLKRKTSRVKIPLPESPRLKSPPTPKIKSPRLKSPPTPKIKSPRLKSPPTPKIKSF
jgi:hypothetical protein